MRSRLLCCIVLLFYSINLIAQQNNVTPDWAFKLSPSGLLLGNISLHTEYHFTPKHSFTAKIGLPVAKKHTLLYNESDVVFTMKALSFLYGFRTYLSKKDLQGIYLEPYFKFNRHISTGLGEGSLAGDKVVYQFTNNYEGTGFGVQAGYQLFISNRLMVDFYLGPEINSSINTFSATELTSTLAWTEKQTKAIERDTRDFINRIPFVKNRYEVLLNKDKRIIEANFLGALPGLRTGIAIGFVL